MGLPAALPLYRIAGTNARSDRGHLATDSVHRLDRSRNAAYSLCLTSSDLLAAWISRRISVPPIFHDFGFWPAHTTRSMTSRVPTSWTSSSDSADRCRGRRSGGARTRESAGTRYALREVPGGPRHRLRDRVGGRDARIAGSGGVRGAACDPARLRRSPCCIPGDGRAGVCGYCEREPARAASPARARLPGPLDMAIAILFRAPHTVRGAAAFARLAGHAAPDMFARAAASRACFSTAVRARGAGDPGLSLSAGRLGPGRGCRRATGVWHAGRPRA